MSLVAAGRAGCWELPHEPDTEWWAHYSTEAEAVTDADPADPACKPTQLAQVCCRIRCDRCGREEGLDELVDAGEGLHYLRAAAEDVIASTEWVDIGNGQHCCWDCPTAAPDLEVEARRPGPLDVPFPGVDLYPRGGPR